jgi:hypothetical protein
MLIVLYFFFQKMPLLWIERNGNFLSIKKADIKGKKERSRIKRRASQQLYCLLNPSNRNCNFSAILPTVRAAPLYCNNSMPRSSQLTVYHDYAYRGQMWQNKISSAIQHTRSDTSCGSCSHTQKMKLSDNTHHMISRQDATLSIAYEIMHPSSETMKSCTC